MLCAWVPGCGTGEVAYALAMLLIERAEAAGLGDSVLVFATETDRDALAAGREGLYPAGFADRLPPDRLRRFFVREAHGLRAGPALRQRMFFAAHDHLSDPPYPRLDLIYCAHHRAGVAAEAGEAIARSFRRGLRPGDLLVQGESPLIDHPGDWFEIVAPDMTILRRTVWPCAGISDVGFAAIFIDPDLRIRRITPVMMRHFDIGPRDLNRSVEDLAGRLDDPDLAADARAILGGSEPVSRQVRGPRGRWFIRRMQPVRAPGVLIHGAPAMFIDVSPLKEAEGEARAAWAYFQSIVDTVREPLVVLDADLRVRSANGSYYRTFRSDPGETEGREIHELGRGQWGDPRLREGLVRALSQGQPFDDLEIEADHEQLGRRTMRLGARRVEGLPLVLLAIEDVTERRTTEAALGESRRRLQTLFENAQDAIFLADDQARYVDANPAACDLTGYSREELLGRTAIDMTPEPDRPAGLALWRSLLKRGRLQGEYQLVCKDGSPIAIEFRAVAHILPGLHLSIARDITERRRLEKEVLEIASEEQRRIGQELHDDAGQVLTGLGLMARVLADRLDAAAPERRIADRIVDGIGDLLDRIRAVTKGPMPVEVDADGLMAALSELAFQTDELEGVACHFECDEPVSVRDNTTATQLYRIAQEAVTNAVRHGQPRTIRIELGKVDGRIHLEIVDDGRGVPEPVDEHAGRGFRIMRHRAGLVGASLSIGRAREGGTAVRCEFSEVNHHAG